MNTLHPDVFMTGIHRPLALTANGLIFSCENHCQGQSRTPQQTTLAVHTIEQMHGDRIRLVLQGMTMADGSAEQRQLTYEIVLNGNSCFTLRQLVMLGSANPATMIIC